MPAQVDALERLREAELSVARRFFPEQASVLEFGSGTGFQASVMAGWGHGVAAVDVNPPSSMAQAFFPVLPIDGVRLPFASESFDVVFSSNVLEHVSDLPVVLNELGRVMKPGALAIHILPTPAWRFWTFLGRYPHLCRRVIQRLLGTSRHGTEGGHDTAGPNRRIPASLLGRVTRMLVDPAHGEYPNAVSELWYFSPRRWRAVFAAQGFTIQEELGTGVFYTGYALMPGSGLNARRRLARILGASTRIYVLKKNG